VLWICKVPVTSVCSPPPAMLNSHPGSPPHRLLQIKFTPCICMWVTEGQRVEQSPSLGDNCDCHTSIHSATEETNKSKQTCAQQVCECHGPFHSSRPPGPARCRAHSGSATADKPLAEETLIFLLCETGSP
jgi:hypothetical protein